ncbi:MAG: glyceraldehyde-3-phosphate dehydrogenase, partial [Thermoprotei archaeon]
EDVVKVLKETPRIVLANSKRTSIRSTAELVELSRDLGRLRYDIPELVIWEDLIHVDGDEVVLIQAVHQESIVIPENIDAIRALTGLASKWDSIRMTDESLGLLRGELIG